MGNHAIRSADLTVVKCLGHLIITASHFAGLGKGPGKVFVPVFAVSFTFFLVVALPDGRHLATVGRKIAHLGKAFYGARFQHNGQGQNLADSWDGLQSQKRFSQFHFVQHNRFYFPDLALGSRRRGVLAQVRPDLTRTDERCQSTRTDR